MKQKTIAILLTCFNRQDKTLSCLSNLYRFSDYHLNIFLVDDGSTDGTAEAIQLNFPDIHIITGNGNLFWNRGMHLAWQEACKTEHDYYLWLNDDVYLYENALNELTECTKIMNDEAIITGIVESKDKSTTLYGGTFNKRLIYPNGEMNEVHHLNGNIVLIPNKIFKVLGNLDPVFHHDLGDVEYGYRARKKGISVVTTRKAIASGEKNPICRERISGVTLRQRFKRLYSPVGSNPNINFYFRKKYKSIFNAIFYYIFQHVLNIAPDYFVKIVFKNKYE